VHPHCQTVAPLRGADSAALSLLFICQRHNLKTRQELYKKSLGICENKKGKPKSL
jgi:hypothetical protein